MRRIAACANRSRVIRDISPKRVYACNKESHAALPALFKQEDGLKHLRPMHKESRGGNVSADDPSPSSKPFLAAKQGPQRVSRHHER